MKIRQSIVCGFLAAILVLLLCTFSTLSLIGCEGPMGPAGPAGIQGEKGEKGDKGDKGDTGVSIVWKGELATAPAGPQLYWAYFNTTIGNAYIYTGTAWELLSQHGADGVDGTDGANGSNGVSINWRGTLTSHPTSPQLNWAYYNSTDKVSYIYNGSTWQVLARDGEVGPQGPQGDPGDNGDTPYIGDNGNWWIGDTDTGIKAQGPQGEPGDDGDTPYIGGNGNWWIGTTDTGVRAQGQNRLEITVEMWDSSGDGWDGGALRINVNGSNFTSNAKLNSGSGLGYHTFVVETEDTVTFYWVSGSNQDENAFAVYYSDNSPVPAFNPVAGASVDTARILLYRQYSSISSTVGGAELGSFTAGAISATPAYYTVFFSANGGSGTVPDPITVQAGTGLTLPDDSGLSNGGYTFSGWNINPSGPGATYPVGAFYVPSGTITLYAKWDANGIGLTLTEKLAWLQNNAQTGGSYTLEVSADEFIDPYTLSYSGKSNITVAIRGIGANRNVYLSSNGSMFTVNSGVTLVLDNITLRGRSANTASLVMVNSGGTLRMNSGSAVTGNTRSGSSTSYGSGVYVAGGTFMMNGGTVSGNTATASSSASSSAYGVGVYVGGGTFTMNGGTVSGNTATASSSATSASFGSVSVSASAYGGGVHVGGGTFMMNGGTVSGNTATASSSATSTYTSTGGVTYASSVSASASAYGGGVHVGGGTFTMNGGTVSGNTTSSSATTAAASTTTTRSVSAPAYGGGVYANQGIFTKTGGTIYGYSSEDAANSNTVKNSSGSVLNNRGHAVYAYVNSSSGKRKESTAGEDVNLWWHYNNDSPVFSGAWDY